MGRFEMSDEVLLERDTPVPEAATITLNRPARGNALTGSMTAALGRILEALASDDSVRVVVLRGADGSKYFCTGMDLSATSSMSSSSSSSSPAPDVFSLLGTFPKPIVARLHGPCLGGGVGLLFACDVRVATSSLYIRFSEVHRGLVPA